MPKSSPAELLALHDAVFQRIVLGQFAAKVAGGFAWSLILNKRVSRVAVSG